MTNAEVGNEGADQANVGAAHRQRGPKRHAGRLFRLVLTGVVLLPGCARNSSGDRLPDIEPPGSIAAGTPHRSEIVPVVDYHIHILGPYALPMPDPLAPAVTLPEELARLLGDRARLLGNVNSVADLTPVFTADAQLLNAYVNPTGWLHDPEWFMRYLNLWQATTRIRYVPNTFAIAGNVGYIAGTVQDSTTGQHFENFLIGIRRGQDGRWRIATESSTRRTPPRFPESITAERLIADLDEAGIQRAVVLSVAFWLGADDEQRRATPVADGRLAVQMENDWTAAQIGRYPDRLVMACGVGVLLDFAVEELVRCSTIPQVVGMKLNLSGSGFRFDDPGHIAKVREIFKAANDHGMAVIIHLEPGRFYGPAEVEIFLDQIASAAPDITIQIAHLAGNGPGITSPEALEAFARLREAGDPRTENLYFDFAGLVFQGIGPNHAALMATRMRQ